MDNILKGSVLSQIKMSAVDRLGPQWTVHEFGPNISLYFDKELKVKTVASIEQIHVQVDQRLFEWSKVGTSVFQNNSNDGKLQ